MLKIYIISSGTLEKTMFCTESENRSLQFVITDSCCENIVEDGETNDNLVAITKKSELLRQHGFDLM